MHDLQGFENAISDVSRLKRVHIANALFWKHMKTMLGRNSKEHLKVHSMKFRLED
jgi:hypothetical protein